MPVLATMMMLMKVGNSCDDDDDDDDDGGGDTLDAGVLPASKQEYSESRNSLPIEQPKPSKV